MSAGLLQGFRDPAGVLRLAATTVSGTVTDETGAVIPSDSVTLTGPNIRDVRSTGDDGQRWHDHDERQEHQPLEQDHSAARVWRPSQAVGRR